MGLGQSARDRLCAFKNLVQRMIGRALPGDELGRAGWRRLQQTTPPERIDVTKGQQKRMLGRVMIS